MIKLIYFFIVIIPSLSLANLTISPVKLVINKNEKVNSLIIRNNADSPRNFQIRAYKISHENGHEIDTETKDLLVTPLSFKITPGRTQVVRVALKNNSTIEELDRAYRISVQELPHQTKKEGAHVHLVTEFKIPVSITNTKPESD